MKKLRILFFIILAITLLIYGADTFFTPLPKYIKEINRMVLLVAIIVISFCNIKLKKHKKS